MDKIKVMVSSTVKDLIGERQCIEDTLSKLELRFHVFQGI